MNQMASLPTSMTNRLFDDSSRAHLSLDSEEIAISVENLDLYYGSTQALKSVSMKVASKRVTAFIGPSGCSTSTLQRCFNLMN